MADHHQREIEGLRTLVVNLANEIDIKNLVLMQKEDLLEEKDRLLEAHKYSLREAHIQESRNSEHMKLEIEKLSCALEGAKEKHGQRMRKNKEQDCRIVDELKELRNHNENLKAEVDTLRKEFEEKGKALHQIESLKQTLALKERSINEELQDARREAINLTKEKERFLSERSSAISVLVSENIERERLLDEKSASITSLTKEWEMRVKEREEAIARLMAQNAEKDHLIAEKSGTIATLTKEKEWLINEISELRNLVEMKKEKLDYEAEHFAKKNEIFNQNSAYLSSVTVERDQLLGAYITELGKTTSMKLENEKLQQALESHRTELDKLIKKHSGNVQESTDICIAEIGKIKHIQPQDRDDLQVNIQNQEDLRAQIDTLKKELEEKEETLQNVEMDNQTLTIKELKSNRELQDARKAATEGLEAMKRPQQSRLLVGIKRMGEVDQRPFREACVKRLRSGDWDEKYGNCEEKSNDLCFSWQSQLSNPAWQPFKKKDIDGKLTEVIDEDDPILEELRKEWGDEVYEAVVEALMGVNEYNASGRYPVSELWNYKEKRKASLAEVIQYVIKQWKSNKSKKKSFITS